MTLRVERVSPRKGTTALYLWAIAQGLWVTLRHFLANLVAPSRMVTVDYPEERKVMPPGYRGKHRLLNRPDGTVKCTACMMCATVCPARCIHIVAEEVADPTIEKAPATFDIDLLKCVFCGYCVEACPVDAIRMDSGIYTFADFRRADFVVHKDELRSTPSQWSEPR
ncbi:MAG: NADH-quinone oxidoreductase subunit I [Candidatus Sericytochromatia bacterium]|nr:NADH-quinone oxidoreductase subunit I [Candidatus Tanganyikabacteria bacterium]